MPGNPRSLEDRLTASLAKVLDQPDGITAFWQSFAPERLRSKIPDRIAMFGSFDGPKPDILFWYQGEPIFYVEAKLDSGTAPLQLSRARSRMRLADAKDDQILLVCQTVDSVPAEIGWIGPTLPYATATWREILACLDSSSVSSRTDARIALDVFRVTLHAHSVGSRFRSKRLALDSKHPYGAVLQAVTRQWDDVQAEFAYGAKIAPRINFGKNSWQIPFRSRDVERMSIRCGMTKEGDERYTSELCLWQVSDLKGSRDGIERHWPHWRSAITADPSLKLHIGGRKEHEREYVEVPPHNIPLVKVAVVRRPGSGFPVADVQQLPFEEAVHKVASLASPYIRLVQRVQISIGQVAL